MWKCQYQLQGIALRLGFLQCLKITCLFQRGVYLVLVSRLTQVLSRSFRLNVAPSQIHCLQIMWVAWIICYLHLHYLSRKFRNSVVMWLNSQLSLPPSTHVLHHMWCKIVTGCITWINTSLLSRLSGRRLPTSASLAREGVMVTHTLFQWFFWIKFRTGLW